jgi:hypothetical protein
MHAWVLQGNAPFLDLVARRLARGGIAVARAEAPWPDWNGLAHGTLRVDLQAAGLERALRLAQRCADEGLRFAEIATRWHPAGEEWGFLLQTGAPEAVRAAVAAVADPLAPLPGAWLPCGPPGAAGFTARVFDALGHSATLWLEATARPSAAAAPPDWQAGLARQAELARMLLLLAEQYLAHYPATAEDDALPAGLPPPGSHAAHYARNLARLIELTLGQNASLRDLLAALSSSHELTAPD